MGNENRKLQLKNEHFDQAAALHTKCFPNGFFSIIGEELIRAFFVFLREDPLGIFIVAEFEGKIVGYVAGSIDRDRTMKSFLLKNFLLIFRIVLIRVPRNLDLIKLGLKRFQSIFIIPEKRKSNINKWSVVNIPKASLMWIAVNPRCRGKGFGSRLSILFREALLEKGCEKFKVGMKASNTAAYKTYLKIDGKVAYDDGKVIIMTIDNTNCAQMHIV